MLQFHLRERGPPVSLSQREWQQLRLDETIGSLSRIGVVRIERTADSVLLFPSHFVGQMRSPHATLTVAPKNREVYDAIERLALEFAGKRSRHFLSRFWAGGDDPAAAFVYALSNCVEEGLPWRYESDVAPTSMPRGKTHFAATITSFASRGIMHRVVATHQARCQPVPFAAIVWSAYRVLCEIPNVAEALRTKSARLIYAFDRAVELPVDEAIAAADALLNDAEELSENARALLMASLALVDRARRAGTIAVQLPVGTARFINLEVLWERAVAGLLSTSYAGTVTLHAMRASGMRLFGDGGPSIDPDVVVEGANGDTELVADAKYKVLADSERNGLAADVYQITCYVDRMASPMGMLVYIGTTDSVVVLGDSLSNGRIISVRVSAENLMSNGNKALARLVGNPSLLERLK